MERPQSASSRIGSIEALRVVACASVLLFHYCVRGSSFGGPGYPELRPWATYGFLGVSLFFVISGFVISNALLRRPLPTFVKARFLRLYPAFLICMTLTWLVGALAGSASGSASLAQWLANLTMVSPAFGQPFVDGVYWSIVVEVEFYALVAGLAAIGLLPGSVEGVVCGWLALAAANEFAIHSSLVRIALVTPYAPLFAIGMLASQWVSGHRRAGTYLLVGVAAALSFCFAERDAVWLFEHGGIVVDRRILLLCYAAIFGLFALAIAMRDVLPASSAIVMLGGLTYPVYLLHQQAGYAGLRLLTPVLGRYEALLAVTALCIVAAGLVHARLEPAARALLRRFLDRLSRPIREAARRRPSIRWSRPSH